MKKLLKKRCKIDKCNRRVYAKGDCRMHYMRLRRNGHYDLMQGGWRKKIKLDPTVAILFPNY